MPDRFSYPHKGRRRNRDDPALYRRPWRHRQLAASISAELEAKVDAAILDISLALNVSDPDPTDSTSTSQSTTDTQSTEIETTTTTTTSTETVTSLSTSVSTSVSVSTTSRTRTITSEHTPSRTITDTRTSTRFTTFTTVTTSTSLTTSTSKTSYTQLTTLFTSFPSSQVTADTSSSSLSVNLPATSGVLGSGDNNDKGFAHDTGAIVGVSVGILVFVLLAGILLFFGIKKYRRQYSISSGSDQHTSPRPPIDGEEEVREAPIDDQAQLSPPLVAATSLGHDSSSGEDGDVPHVMASGSVDIHGASIESGGTTSYPNSQGHSTSSGDHLLGGGAVASGGGFAPFALRDASPVWQSSSQPAPLSTKRALSTQSHESYPYSMTPASPTTSSSGHGHTALLPPPPPLPAVAERPASLKSSKRRSLLDRVLGAVGNRRSSVSSSSASDTPRSYSPLAGPTSPPMSELPYSDSTPWRRPQPPPETTSPGAGAQTLSLPPTLRERNLSSPEGLLHPKRPDLITLESSRTLMDHVDYSRPIVSETHALDRESSITNTLDTTKTQDTEGPT